MNMHNIMNTLILVVPTALSSIRDLLTIVTLGLTIFFGYKRLKERVILGMSAVMLRATPTFIPDLSLRIYNHTQDPITLQYAVYTTAVKGEVRNLLRPSQGDIVYEPSKIGILPLPASKVAQATSIKLVFDLETIKVKKRQLKFLVEAANIQMGRGDLPKADY